MRFGTCGSIREDVPAGAIVVCTPGSTMVRREPDAFEPSGSVRAGKGPYHVCDVVPSNAALSAALEAELKAGLGADGSVVGALNASGCSFYSSQVIAIDCLSLLLIATGYSIYASHVIAIDCF